MLNVYLDRIDGSYYRYQTARDVLMDQFGVSSLIPLDLEGREEMTSAMGALLMYLRETQKGDLDQFRRHNHQAARRSDASRQIHSPQP